MDFRHSSSGLTRNATVNNGTNCGCLGRKRYSCPTVLTEILFPIPSQQMLYSHAGAVLALRWYCPCSPVVSGSEYGLRQEVFHFEDHARYRSLRWLNQYALRRMERLWHAI